jgi:hypothetical protein
VTCRAALDGDRLGAQLGGQARVGRIVRHAAQCQAAHPRGAARAARAPALAVCARLGVGAPSAGDGQSVRKRG